MSPSQPQNSASTCSTVGPTNPSGTGSATPGTVHTGDSTLLTVAVTGGTNPASTGLAVSGDLSSIGGAASAAFFDDGSHGDVTAGDGTFSLSTTVDAATSPGNKTIPTTIADDQSRNGSAPIALTVTGDVTLTPIHTIQGAQHLSPLAGQTVDTSGIVTQRRSNGVVIQDPSPDDDPTTSEGVFVFTSAAPPAFAALGASIQVHGQVQEFRNSDTADLTVTEIGASPTLSLLSMTNPLPAAVVIGTDRTPPGAIIENDSTSSVEDPGVLFDPSQDGLDFWESLESMRIELTDAVAVGPENSFGEIQIASQGTSGTFTPRGGLILTADDFEPRADRARRPDPAEPARRQRRRPLLGPDRRRRELQLRQLRARVQRPGDPGSRRPHP